MKPLKKTKKKEQTIATLPQNVMLARALLSAAERRAVNVNASNRARKVSIIERNRNGTHFQNATVDLARARLGSNKRENTAGESANEGQGETRVGGQPSPSPPLRPDQIGGRKDRRERGRRRAPRRSCGSLASPRRIVRGAADLWRLLRQEDVARTAWAAAHG